ncbi:hypothetical protein [Aeoliella sp. SH292]|uniref:hypothetical protein n=1 Tax=Aeoliella sp. SH292 TaxID=3454464 RepID=UPI003F955D22
MLSSSKFEELEKLVSEMYDDSLSVRDMQRLEELLIDDPLAQLRYKELVGIHIALSVASGGSDTAAPSDVRGTEGLLLASRNERTPVSKAPAARPVTHLLPWALAAAVALALGLFALQSAEDSALKVESSSLANMAPSYPALPEIKHVSWEGPSYQPAPRDAIPTAAIFAGAISLRLGKGKTADGYVICLQPGMSVDLVSTFDATGENSLSIVELTGGDRPAAKKLTFHNAGEGPMPLHANPIAKNRRYGVLGHWSEANFGPHPRYFLLTGVHKLAIPTAVEDWRMSDMKVLIEHENAVHIGWDDSGPPPSEGHPYRPDGDYDDLAATLFYTSNSSDELPASSSLRVLASHDPTPINVPEVIDSAFEFELPPGSIALVKAICEARDPNALVIMDCQTKEVVWSGTKQPAEGVYLGTISISNPTQAARKLCLLAIHKVPTATDEVWHASKLRTLYEQPNFFILGFEDSRNDDDFNDLRVNLLIESAPNSVSDVLQ